MKAQNRRPAFPVHPIQFRTFREYVLNPYNSYVYALVKRVEFCSVQIFLYEIGSALPDYFHLY